MLLIASRADEIREAVGVVDEQSLASNVTPDDAAADAAWRHYAALGAIIRAHPGWKRRWMRRLLGSF